MFLILSVCLLSSPSTCKTERIQQSTEDGSPITCMVEGQGMIAVWQQQHALWHVERWKCVSRRQLETAL